MKVVFKSRNIHEDPKFERTSNDDHHDKEGGRSPIRDTRSEKI